MMTVEVGLLLLLESSISLGQQLSVDWTLQQLLWVSGKRRSELPAKRELSRTRSQLRNRRCPVC